MGEWESLEIERIRRLCESMSWMMKKSEETDDKIVITLERKIPLEVITTRRELEERAGTPT